VTERPVAEAYAAYDARDWPKAAALLRSLAAARSPDPELLFRLGDSLYQLDRLNEALPLLEQSVQLDDRRAAALYKLGNVLKDLERLDEALSCYRRALQLDSRHAQAFNNAGIVLEAQDKPEEALDCYRRAVATAPGLVAAQANLVVLLHRLGRHAELGAAYESLARLRPDTPGDWHGIGNACQTLGRHDDALRCYRAALALAPGDAEAHSRVGISLDALGRHAEAVKSFELAVAADPGQPYAAGMVVGCASHICEWRGRAERIRRLEAGVRAGEPVVPPFYFFTLLDDPAAQRACAAAYVRRHHAAAHPPLWRGERYRHDRIRLAYVSADFHNHPVTWLISELIERHDRGRFEVHGYSFGRGIAGAARERLMAGFDRFADLGFRPDAEIAAALRDAEIDIAVDLMGHTAHSRPGIFARRPAPAQASYLGFPATMGAPFIDYILADRFVIPGESKAHYSENVVYLPDTFQVNDTTHRPAPRAPTRAEAGLPEQGFVYCCFNNAYKLTPEFFDIWMRILLKVEGSVLWLLVQDPVAKANLTREVRARGVDPARLVFAPRVSPQENLARYALADLFLDTLPVNAGTTASAALWAGLPILTCPGRAFVARAAGSLLHAVGLPELIARTPEDYESLAIGMAGNPGRLRAIREKLAANRVGQPLFDIDRFRRHIESAYRTMWEISERGEAPRPIVVETIAAAPR
jgi:protein O-GlcNAc transferase